MKKSIRISALAAVVFLGACSKMDVEVTEMNAVDPSTVLSVTGSDAASMTRTTIDDSFNILWRSNDAIGIFSDKALADYQDKTTYKTTDTKNIAFLLNESSAAQSEGEFALDKDQNKHHFKKDFTGRFAWANNTDPHIFYSYYPYHWQAHFTGNLENIPFVINSVQTQMAENPTAHVEALDFCYAEPVVMTPPAYVQAGDYINGKLNLKYKHAFTLLEFNITNTTGKEITLDRIRVDAGDRAIAGEFVVNIMNGALTACKTTSASGEAIEGAGSSRAELIFAGGQKLDPSASVKAYLMINAVDASTEKIKFRVMTQQGYADFSGGATFEAGKRYHKDMELNNLTADAAKVLNVLDFESVKLEEDGIFQKGTLVDEGMPEYWIPAEYSHTFGNLTFNTFVSQGAWGGFTFSNHKDMTTPGFENQYSVYNENAHSGDQFAIIYDGSGYGGPTQIPTISLTSPKVVDHLYISNSTYAVLSMEQGDAYAKKFSYEDEDWFKVQIIAYNGEQKVGYMDYYLADFRTPTSEGIVKGWKKLDMSSFGQVTALKFVMYSSDLGAGSVFANTPAYFCIDDIAVLDNEGSGSTDGWVDGGEF